MKKKKVLMAMVVVIMGLVSCNARSGAQQKETKSSDDFGFVLSDDDREDFLFVFENYLKISKERGDSTIKFMRENGIDAEGLAQFKSNQQHVDSVMNKCIQLTKDGLYGSLYDLLEKERKNILVSPGSSIQNILDLTVVVRKMCLQKYAKDMRAFAQNVLPWDEFGVVAMDMARALGKGTHPDYGEMLLKVASEYEVIEQSDSEKQDAGSFKKTLEAWHKVADASLEEGATLNYIASMIHLSGLYKQVGLTESADSCINAVKDLPEFEEVRKGLNAE
ncbi:MAG: hypothetical protein J5506_10940 [Prevotella sp.]|nr:hypothetical protein [Prevotella sp.]